MGTKKTEQKNQIAGKTPEQKQLGGMATDLAGMSMGQMGDLSQLAQGNLSQLDPAMLRAIEEAQASSKTQIEQAYDEQLRAQMLGASGAGIAGSSMDAIGRVMLGQTRNNQLGALASQGAQARMQMPFQLAQMQMGANAQLGQQALGAINPMMGLENQARIAKSKVFGKESGGAFGQAAGVASSFAGGGAFAEGGIFA